MDMSYYCSLNSPNIRGDMDMSYCSLNSPNIRVGIWI